MLYEQVDKLKIIVWPSYEFVEAVRGHGHQLSDYYSLLSSFSSHCLTIHLVQKIILNKVHEGNTYLGHQRRIHKKDKNN